MVGNSDPAVRLVPRSMPDFNAHGELCIAGNSFEGLDACTREAWQAQSQITQALLRFVCSLAQAEALRQLWHMRFADEVLVIWRRKYR